MSARPAARSSLVSLTILLGASMALVSCVESTPDAGPDGGTELVRPFLNAVMPESPGVVIDIQVTGAADPATEIDLFANADCQGTPVTTGASNPDTGEFTFQVRVAPGTTTSFSAQARVADTLSECSVEDVSYTLMPEAAPITATTANIVLGGGGTTTLQIPHGTGTTSITFTEESYLPAGLVPVEINAVSLSTPVSLGTTRFLSVAAVEAGSRLVFARLVVFQAHSTAAQTLYLVAEFTDEVVHIEFKSGMANPIVSKKPMVDSPLFARRVGEPLVTPVALEIDAPSVLQYGTASHAVQEQLALLYITDGILENSLNTHVVPSTVRAWTSESNEPYDGTDAFAILNSIRAIAGLDFAANLTRPAVVVLGTRLDPGGAIPSLGLAFVGSICAGTQRAMYHSLSTMIGFSTRLKLLVRNLAYTLGLRRTEEAFGTEASAICTGSLTTSTALMCEVGAMGYRLTTDDVAQLETTLASRRLTAPACLME